MRDLDIITSPQDTRHYRRSVLQNGLQVLLISDPEIVLTDADLDSGADSSHSEVRCSHDYLRDLVIILHSNVSGAQEKFPRQTAPHSWLALTGRRERGWQSYL